MSNLTKKLQQQLITGATRPLMQDANKHWYNGNELNLEKTTWLTYWNNQGIGHNDIVLVSLSNSVTYSIVMESLWEIGAIAHPINPATTEIQLSELEEQYNYSALIFNHEAVEPDDLKNTFMAKPRLTTLHEPEVQIFIRRIHESHAAKVSEDNNLAIIMHTSGTTGTPKRVGLTHEQLCDNALNIKASQKLTDKDKTIILMPMFHVNAMVISNLATRLSGGQILFRERFSAHNFWSEISQEQVTWASLTPAIIEILLQRPEQPFNTKLRFLRTASAPLLPSTHDSFNNRFDVPLIESYGMTEAASQIAQNPLDDPRQNSVGKVLGPEIKIIDSNGNELEKNQVGEVALKGKTVITHYLDAQPESFDDGWLLTGDLGMLDTDNYLHIVGRRKEMIIRGGENITPLEVENCLNVLPFIKEIAVVGIPDKIYGESVTAVIVSNEEQDDNRYHLALLKHLANSQLLPVQRPTKYLFFKKLPKNATGKVQKSLLVKEIEAEELAKKEA